MPLTVIQTSDGSVYTIKATLGMVVGPPLKCLFNLIGSIEIAMKFGEVTDDDEDESLELWWSPDFSSTGIIWSQFQKTHQKLGARYDFVSPSPLPACPEQALAAQHLFFHVFNTSAGDSTPTSAPLFMFFSHLSAFIERSSTSWWHRNRTASCAVPLGSWKPPC